VMDRFVTGQWPSEHLRHDVTVFELSPVVVGKPAILARDWNDPVTVTGDVTRALDLLDGNVRFHIPVLGLAGAVGGAETASCRSIRTTIDDADPVHLLPQRAICADVAIANQTQIVTVAQPSLGGEVAASLSHARFRLRGVAD